MSDGVTIATISTAGSLLLAYLNARLSREVKRQGAVTERIRDQVENTHSTNFRDDHDAMRDEVRAGFTEIRGEFVLVRKDMAGVHEDVRGLRGEVAELRVADAQQDAEILRLKQIS